MNCTIITEDPPYVDDFEATLTGWVAINERVMAVVVPDGENYPVLIHQSRVKFYL